MARALATWRRRLLIAVLTLGMLALPGIEHAATATASALPPGDPAKLPALVSTGGPRALAPSMPSGNYNGPVPGVSTNPKAAGSTNAPAAKAVRELTALRTARTETWLNSDGSRTLKSYGDDRFYKASDGSWQRIDDRLVPDARVRDTFHTKHNSFVATFRPLGRPGQGGIEVSVGAQRERFVPIRRGTNRIVPKVSDRSGQTVTYPGVWPGVDLQYHLHGSTVEEDLVIHRHPDRTRFAFATTGARLLPDPAAGKGAFQTGVSAGRAIRFDAPVVFGRDGTPVPAAQPLQQMAGSTAALSIDARWLSRLSASAFPIVLDPSTRGTYNADTSNAYRTDGVGNCSSCGFQVGNPNTVSGTYWRSTAHFPYESLLVPNERIISATLSLTRTSGVSSNQPFNVFWASGASYAGATPSGQQYGTSSFLTSGSVDVSTLIQSWILGNVSGALMGFGTTEASAKNYKVLSGSLSITYDVAPTSPTAIAPVDGTVTANTSPTLSVNPSTDGDGDSPVQYWFDVATDPTGYTGEVAGSGWQTGTSWTVPAGSLLDGVTYYWTAFAWDGVATQTISTTSFANSLTIKLRLGASTPSPGDGDGPATVNLATGNVTVGAASATVPSPGGNLGVSLTYNSQQLPNNGLTGQYINDVVGDNVISDNLAAGGLRYQRVDPLVQFTWGSATPAPAVNTTHFEVRWTGFVTVPTTGTYQFGALSDDGARIWVNGVQTLDDWTTHTANSVHYGTNTVSLTAGTPVSIQVDYFQASGPASMALYAKGTPSGGGSIPSAQVPASWLTTTAPPVPTGWSFTGGQTQAEFVSAHANDDTITLSDGVGHQFEFVASATGGWTPAFPGHDVLSVADDGTISVLADDGRTYTFTNAGNLQSITSADSDLNPTSTIYTWTGNPTRLTSLTDPVSGRSVTLRYGGDASCPTGAPSGFDAAAPAGMLCDVELWDGTVTKFWYVNGELGRVENPGSSITDFAYTGGLLTGVRDPLASDAVANSAVTGRNPGDADTWTAIAYDSSNRVHSVTLPAPSAGAARPSKTYTYGSGTTTIATAGVTSTSSVAYDSANRQTSATDATGKTGYIHWDAMDREVAQIDPAGFESTVVYDSQGRMTDQWGPAPSAWFPSDGPPDNSHLSSTPHSTMAYDGGLTGLAGTYWTTPDETGNPILHDNKQPGSGDAYFTWGTGNPGAGFTSGDNWSGRLTGTITLAQAGTYSFQMNLTVGAQLYIDGSLVTSQAADPSPNSATTTAGTFANNVAGSSHQLRIDLSDTSGDASLTMQMAPPSAPNTFSNVPASALSPNFGLVTSQTDPDGKTIATGYSNGSGIGAQFGLPTSSTADPSGLALTSTTGYEAPGSGFLRATSGTRPAGSVTQATVTYYGATETRSNPCTSGTAVNQGGRQKITTGADPDGTGPLAPMQQEVVYDASGRVVAARTVNGTTVDPWTCTTYDSRGRPTQVTFPAYGADTTGRTVTYNYAVGGNPLVTSATDTANSTTTTGGVITTTVDLLGRVVSYTDDWGVTTSTAFDQAGRVTSTTQGSQPAVGMTYDDAGRLLTETRGGSTIATVSYDSFGRPSGYTYPTGTGKVGNGTSGTVSYDSLGRNNGVTWNGPTGLVTSDSVTKSLGGRVTDQSIDGVDPNTSGQNFLYDGAGRLTDAYVPGHHLVYGYSSTAPQSCAGPPAGGPDSNRTSLTDNGAVTAYYCYNNADQLITTTASGVGTIGYDSHGNTTTIAGETMGYDVANRHLSTTSPTASVAYTRDPIGRIMSRTATATPTVDGTSTAWNGTPVTSFSLARPAATQPGDLLLAAVTSQSSSATVTAPSGWTLVQSQADGTAPNKLSVYSHVASSTDPTGWTFTFSTSAGYAAAILSYTGVDPTTQIESSAKSSNTSSVTNHVDPAVTSSGAYRRMVTFNSILAVTTLAPASGGTEHASVQILNGAAGGTLESADYPIAASGSTGTRTTVGSPAASDALVSVLLKPATQVERYSYSDSSDSPTMTLSGTGGVLETVVGLPGGTILTDRGTSQVWSYPNVHGDVAAVCNGSGVKQGPTLTYDPFGNPLAGTADNSDGSLDYGYEGSHERPLEHELNAFAVIEMGARQYSPLLGRFLQVDPVPGGSANAYAYVYGDPVNSNDLNGTCSNLKWCFYQFSLGAVLFFFGREQTTHSGDHWWDPVGAWNFHFNRTATVALFWMTDAIHYLQGNWFWTYMSLGIAMIGIVVALLGFATGNPIVGVVGLGVAFLGFAWVGLDFAWNDLVTSARNAALNYQDLWITVHTLFGDITGLTMGGDHYFHD
jgi:RHS repeat-associated protein